MFHAAKNGQLSGMFLDSLDVGFDNRVYGVKEAINHGVDVNERNKEGELSCFIFCHMKILQIFFFSTKILLTKKPSVLNKLPFINHIRSNSFPSPNRSEGS